ncbi:hypothetical protein LTR78_006476 [Recurvomyces mirabilis]|uniref:Cytochrome P450 n=1 Tax=Recurvomyces mirabilis TaxID=574656 RepID=A0AAE0WKV2_9PEZI|nr:hypothetical protein LTR78_006476 [Recurvomyces mirabilis]KAK5151105.1 hypothetical protein LTS14_009601 [Recurvomyces mirabilis]
MDSPSVQKTPYLTIYLLPAIILALLAYKAYTIATNPLRHIPGPWISLCTNLRLKYAILTGERVRYIHSLHSRYGPIVRISPSELDLCDAAAAKTVYKMGSRFMKTRFYSVFTGSKVVNVFSSQDAQWHGQHRRLTSANFSEQSVKKMEPFIAQNVQLAVRRMREEVQRLGYVDVFKWFMFMATDVIGEASFGESFRMLETGKENQYISDLETLASKGIYRVELEGLVNIVAKLPFGPVKEILRIAARMNAYAEDSVQRYWRLYSADPENVKPTLLTKEYAAVEDGTLEPLQLRRDASGYIIAGTDTTAVTGTYAVWELSKLPEVQEALCREVADLPEGFDDEILRTLPLLDRVLQETLRLHPAVEQGLPRAVPDGGAEFGGYHVPAGQVVGIQAYSMHRDSTVWRDPETFDPSRWEESTKAMQDNFYPFGGGSRVCLGMHFAKVELRHALANFYRTFDVGMKPAFVQGFTEKDMEAVSYFLSPPRGKRCYVMPRKSLS